MAHHIKLLGSLTVEKDGRPSGLMNSHMGSALVVYLIIEGGIHSREAVADLLWESTSTSHSLQNLRELIRRTKRLLPAVKTTRRTIFFQADDTTTVDYLQLQEGVSTTDVHTLYKVLQLYQGDLLGTFHLEGTPRFNEWLILERERLRLQVLAAYQRLCKTCKDERLWEQGVNAARQWITTEPLDEEGHRWLIQMLAGNGQLTAAQQAYARCCQILATELGSEPEETTKLLAQQLVRLAAGQRPMPLAEPTLHAVLKAAKMPPPDALPVQAYVPYLRNNDFVGREAELQQIARIFGAGPLAGRPPVVAVTGMGGLGKTQTAVEFCYRYGRYFPGGVYWLSFADAANVADEVITIGSQRGMGLYREAEKLTPADRIGRVRRAWQEQTPRLLIFDNCEDEGLLQTWLPVSGGCYILLTSRQTQWSRGLDLHQLPLDALPEEESHRLLKQIMPHVSDAEAAEIAHEVGHLPLALHLAGSFLYRYDQITAADYLSQLRDKNLLHHPSLQGYGLSYSPTGHELSVARTYAVSLEQLNEQDDVSQSARLLLTHAVCFAPGEPLEKELLQATVLGRERNTMAVQQFEAGLVKLWSLGFIRIEERERLVIHRLVNAFTQSVLAAETAEATTAVEHTINGMVTAVWDKSLYLGTLPLPPNQMRYITDKALRRKDLAAATLANHLGRHFVDSEQFEKAFNYFEAALAIREPLMGKTLETAITLSNIGTTSFRTGAYEKSQHFFERASSICQEVLGSKHPRTARTINNLGIVQSRLGNYEKAQAYYMQALDIYAKTSEENDPMIPMILTNMGINYRRLGEFDQGRASYQKAIAFREATLGLDDLMTIATVHNLGYLELTAGNYTEARYLFGRVLPIRKKILGTDNVATALTELNLARLDGIDQQYAQAEAKLLPILETFLNHLGEHHSRVGEILTQLGVVYLKQEKIEQAADCLHRAVSIHETVGETRDEMVDTLLALADFYLQTGDIQGAQKITVWLLRICKQIVHEGHFFFGQVYLRLGEWHLQVQEEQEAQRYFANGYGVLAAAVSPTHIDMLRLKKLIS